VHRLESVAHIGQGPPHDDAHGVIEIGLLHLVFEIDGQNFFREIVHLIWKQAVPVNGARGGKSA
jgi:hypothetical protein